MNLQMGQYKATLTKMKNLDFYFLIPNFNFNLCFELSGGSTQISSLLYSQIIKLIIS